MSRLTIDLTDEQHKHIKAAAALQGKTIRQFAVERLFPADGALGDEDQAWQEFKDFIIGRVDDALADPASWQTFDEVWPEGGALDKAA